LQGGWFHLLNNARQPVLSWHILKLNKRVLKPVHFALYTRGSAPTAIGPGQKARSFSFDPEIGSSEKLIFV
jgi:hypothetical protein